MHLHRDQHPWYDVLQVDSCGKEIAIQKPILLETNHLDNTTNEMYEIFVYYAVVE